MQWRQSCAARTTNAVEGQLAFWSASAFQCHHPTLWTFVHGIKKDLQTQSASFLQGIASVAKQCEELKARVQNTVDQATF